MAISPKRTLVDGYQSLPLPQWSRCGSNDLPSTRTVRASRNIQRFRCLRSFILLFNVFSLSFSFCRNPILVLWASFQKSPYLRSAIIPVLEIALQNLASTIYSLQLARRWNTFVVFLLTKLQIQKHNNYHTCEFVIDDDRIPTTTRIQFRGDEGSPLLFREDTPPFLWTTQPMLSKVDDDDDEKKWKTNLAGFLGVMRRTFLFARSNIIRDQVDWIRRFLQNSKRKKSVDFCDWIAVLSL